MANGSIETEKELDELDVSLWKAVAAFVKKCGGELAKASPDDREVFAEELETWAVLTLDDGEES